MTNLKSKEFIIQSKLLLWYKKNKRNLPWRKLNKEKLPHPYFVMVSEFMLQQTTVGVAKIRFQEFVSKWPNIVSLSKVSNSRILNFWSGLGYYRRATNLLKSIKIIKKKFKSKIPNNYSDLIELPGIGDYTAKAILGIAYNKPVMPMDANIERILARLYGCKLPLIKIKTELKKKSELFISKKSSTNLIQAFMDYGSIICIPRNPKCYQCLISAYCKSFSKNLQNSIPNKEKKKFKKLKKFSRAYILINEKNEILVRKRSTKGMLASMLEVPNDIWVKNKKNLKHDDTVSNFKTLLKSRGFVEYSFSHFDLVTEVFFAKIKKDKFFNEKWIKKSNILKSGLPTVMKKFIEMVI